MLQQVAQFGFGALSHKQVQANGGWPGCFQTCKYPFKKGNPGLGLVGIPQSRLRYVEPGQSAEVVLRLLPGRTLSATVDRVVSVNAAAQLQPSGLLPQVPTAADPALPFAVVLELDDESIDLAKLPGGTVGTAAIYTDSVAATHVIRRVMMRMEAWMNYVKP